MQRSQQADTHARLCNLLLEITNSWQGYIYIYRTNLLAMLASVEFYPARDRFHICEGNQLSQSGYRNALPNIANTR